VANSKKVPNGTMFDQKPFCLKYLFSVSICKPNSVKWEAASIVLFQKLGSFFLNVYDNTWDSQPSVQLSITTKTVVTEHFTVSPENRKKVAILVISNTSSTKDGEWSVNLGGSIIHLSWIQAFLDTPAAVAAASITKVLQKAYPVSIVVTHSDFIVHGGADSGFAYTLQINMSDNHSGSIIFLERDLLELHESLIRKYNTDIAFPSSGKVNDDTVARSQLMSAYFSKILSVRRICRSPELFKWVTADDELYSSTSRNASSSDRRNSDVLAKTELNTCVVKFSLHNAVDSNLMEILNRYAIDTAHFCFAICVVVEGKCVAQSDLFYDVKSPDIKPLFIPLSQLPDGEAVSLKFLVLSDKLRIDASSLDDWKLVEGMGSQCSGVFQSNGSVIVEVRSKSRLTYMKYETQDKIDHAFTFHLQANEALADNQNERALALNLVALSWWQRHKMMHHVFCKVLIETGSLYFLHQNDDMAVAFIEAGLAYSHRLKLRSVDQQDGTNTDFIQNDSIADGLQELAMARFYKGDYVRSISCLLEALHMKQQFYLEEELDDVMLDAAANKISLLYTQLLFIISEALSSGKQTGGVVVVSLASSSFFKNCIQTLWKFFLSPLP
jgi:hypothetical protein